MSLYPSLEDMKVDKILQQDQQSQQQNRPTNVPTAPQYQPLIYPGTNPSQAHGNQNRPLPVPPQHPLYPTMNAYMDLDLTSVELQILQKQEEQFKSLQLAQQSRNQVATYANNKSMIAPLSGNSVGLRSQVTNGVREVILCKGADGKLGMRCKAINNGIFVVLVTQGNFCNSIFTLTLSVLIDFKFALKQEVQLL